MQEWFISLNGVKLFVDILQSFDNNADNSEGEGRNNGLLYVLEQRRKSEPTIVLWRYCKC